jgi:hypothetical protein
MIPKVKFKVKPLEEYIESLYYFLNVQKNDWDKGIFREYPQLKRILVPINGINERKRIIYDFFHKMEVRRKPEFNVKRKMFQKSWDIINDKALKSLLEINEIEWPKAEGNITGYLTLNPICPRYLENNSFDSFYDFSTHTMKTLVLHEVSHFIYFKKWKQVFPKISVKAYNGPGLVWELSEMIPSVILSDKRIQRIHRHTPVLYSEYKALKIDNKPLIGHLREFYDNRDDFEDFLKNSWKFVKMHEKAIMMELERK